MKQVKAFGFDQGADRDVGVLFLSEVAKTLSNGSCPGHHNGVLIINSSGGGITTTLDANYFKGQGLRQGVEREYIAITNENTVSDKRRDDTENR